MTTAACLIVRATWPAALGTRAWRRTAQRDAMCDGEWVR